MNNLLIIVSMLLVASGIAISVIAMWRLKAMLGKGGTLWRYIIKYALWIGIGVMPIMLFVQGYSLVWLVLALFGMQLFDNWITWVRWKGGQPEDSLSKPAARELNPDIDVNHALLNQHKDKS